MADERNGPDDGKDFAKKQLEKYGWRQGKGLGKEEDGISKAIKVGIKNDTNGVGYDLGEQFTFHWWDHVFNKTAQSLVVEQCEDGVKVSKNNKVTYKSLYNKRSNKHSGTPLLYGRFVQASSAELQHRTADSDSDEENASSQCPEDKLFGACGGRTAHKAARHGFKLNGKLLRLEEQEKQALSAASSLNNSPAVSDTEDKLHNEATSVEGSEENCKNKTKKRNKRKTERGMDTELLNTAGVRCDEGKSTLKRKKKDKKYKGLISCRSDSTACTGNEHDLTSLSTAEEECQNDRPKKKRDRAKLKDHGFSAALEEGPSEKVKKNKKKKVKKKGKERTYQLKMK